MIDLHTHTTASDGTSSPQMLVSDAVMAGVGVLAVTDHDTLAGVDAARATALEVGLHLIGGVEISTSLDGAAGHLFNRSPRDIHLLAYFPAGDVSADFRNWLHTLEENRWARNRELLGRLAHEGIEIEEEDLRRKGGTVAGRVHLASILLERCKVRTLDEAFRRYLGEQASIYVPRQSPPISIAIAKIHESGGIASLAHPIRFWGSHWDAADGLCEWLSRSGLDAMEVWHSEQDATYSHQLYLLALRHGLRMTGGSDFHGDNKPGIAIGVGYGNGALVPMDVLQASWADAATPLF